MFDDEGKHLVTIETWAEDVAEECVVQEYSECRRWVFPKEHGYSGNVCLKLPFLASRPKLFRAYPVRVHE